MNTVTFTHGYSNSETIGLAYFVFPATTGPCKGYLVFKVFV